MRSDMIASVVDRSCASAVASSLFSAAASPSASANCAPAVSSNANESCLAVGLASGAANPFASQFDEFALGFNPFAAPLDSFAVGAPADPVIDASVPAFTFSAQSLA